MPRSAIKDRVVLDWIRFVVPYAYDPSTQRKYITQGVNVDYMYAVNLSSAKNLLYAVLNALGLDGVGYTDASVNTLTTLSRALWGYDATVVKGHCRVMYKAPHDMMTKRDLQMGVCVELSSHALRDIEQGRGFSNWFEWFAQIFELFPEVSFTRIDIAHDYFKALPHLDPYHLHRMVKYQQRKMITSARKTQWVEELDPHSGECRGATWYLGGSDSKWRLRVYDKYLERIYQHGDTWLRAHKIKHWTRWEIQCNGQSAPQVADLIAGGVSPSRIWLDIIRKVMTIKANNKDIIAGRTAELQRTDSVKVVVPEWWATFVDYDNQAKFDYSGQSPHYTYDRHMRWLGRAVMPSLTKDLIVQLYLGGDPGAWLNHVLDQTMTKMTPKDIDDLVEYAKQVKLSDYHSSNSFDFSRVVNQIADRVTGMVSQRAYDMRNGNAVPNKIPLSGYDEFVANFGIANNNLKLRQGGVVSDVR